MKTRQPKPNSEARLSELVAAARAGDQQAFTELYETASQEVYRTTRAILRSEELARDVQQDAFVFAFTHLERLDNPEKFRPWLRAIAVNLARSALRKQTPILFTELENEEGEGLPERADLSAEASPELSLERKETARLVNEILDDLSDGQRAAVGMYYYEQMTVAEIADSLGISTGTVKAQLSRGRKKIEDAVRTLEKRGVKLYGLSPVSFLVALLKRQSPPVREGEKEVAKVLIKSGVTVGAKAAVVGGAGAATEAVVLHVGRSFFETVAGKLVLGVIVAGVVAGSAAGYRWVKDKLLEKPEPIVPWQNEELPDTPTTPTMPWEISDTESETVERLYVSLESEETAPEETEPRPTESQPAAPDSPPGGTVRPSEPQPTEPAPTESTELTESTEPTEEPHELVSGSCGDNLTWTLDLNTGVLTLSGSGAMEYSLGIPPWIDYGESITAVTLPEGLTSIGNNAFSECDALRRVSIPASVTDIGTSAFANCNSLVEINVDPGNLTYCSLEGVLINKEKKQLVQYPIGRGSSSYAVPEGITSIEREAFYGCEGLESVTLPESLHYIGLAAFCGCDSLAYVNIPESVATIDASAFENCPALKSVTIPIQVTYIGSGAFGGDNMDVEDGKVDGFTIYGVPGSRAQAYAEEYGFIFLPLGGQGQ